MKRFLALILALILLGGWFWRHEILERYALLFCIDTAQRGADAILVLGGNKSSRLPHAISLLKAGYAPLLLVTEVKRYSNQTFDGLLRHESDEVVHILSSLHLPHHLIPSLKGGATSTYDEAYDFFAYAKDSNIRSIIIVTDAFHTRRALGAFLKVQRRLQEEKIQIQISPAPNTHFNEKDWYLTEAGLQAYILEGIKTFLYLITSQNLPLIKER
ncbi:MAG: YdcF family protein [Wolinella succinogenes]|uniref:YdcF family protein n=1 Tax=Wolinella succinogenes TaxID=844 RepID=UPI0016ABC24B|nr:YdcF family protein [Wolinella succinogenes]NLU33783.1 YdcF family protein [Wolinella succinogenes]